jgi:hypothetical protein
VILLVRGGLRLWPPNCCPFPEPVKPNQNRHTPVVGKGHRPAHAMQAKESQSSSRRALCWSVSSRIDSSCRSMSSRSEVRSDASSCWPSVASGP